MWSHKKETRKICIRFKKNKGQAVKIDLEYGGMDISALIFFFIFVLKTTLC